MVGELVFFFKGQKFFVCRCKHLDFAFDDAFNNTFFVFRYYKVLTVRQFEFVCCFVRPEDYGFGDFEGIEESAHEPERLPCNERCGEGTVKFLVGNVEADPRLFWLGIFYVDVIFGK